MSDIPAGRYDANGGSFGHYLHIQRLSTEDGPGIRSTVFLKGCTLRCGWCHNPESLTFQPQVQWLENRCIGCDTCLTACPNGSLSRHEDVCIDRRTCDGCGMCAQECPTGAMELLGTKVSPEALLAELIKDRAFYEGSCGGVTLSGGEPLFQPVFSTALLALLQEEGIHTALDTCGMSSRKALRQVLPHADLVLFDLKDIDPHRHADFTGASNQVILENLLLAGELINSMDAPPELWVRTPLIPGATATRENLLGIGGFLNEHLDGIVERWELCAFNNLCRDKYHRLDIHWAYADTALLTDNELEELAGWARISGVDPEVVVATGATRIPS